MSRTTALRTGRAHLTLLPWLACVLFAGLGSSALRAATFLVPGTNITLTYVPGGTSFPAIIINCNPDATGALIIPAALGGAKVDIGFAAFAGRHGLTSVTIPASVTAIGSSAFSRCRNLTSIDVDTSNPAFTSIEGALFNKAITSLLQMPGARAGAYAVPPSVTFVADGAFSGCTSLTSVNIPSSVTSIGDSAFSGCTSLTSINVDAANPNFASAGGVLFNKMITALIQAPIPLSGAYVIPPSVTSIGDYAFNSCTNLTGVTLPASVISIGYGAFSNCTKLTSATFLGNAPGSFDEFVFSGAAPSFVIRYPLSAAGFSTPTWKGYPALPYAPSGFAAWATTVGLSGLNAAPTDDPDHDGVLNLLEYAFGTSPTLATPAAQRPSAALETVAGQRSLVLTHRRRKTAALTFAYEQATNLAAPNAWSPAALTPTLVNANVDGDGQTELVSVALPLGADPRVFLRLSVSQ